MTMTGFAKNQAVLADLLTRVASLILGLSAAGFILGVVLHVADRAGAGGWMIGSFAAITFGTGFLAVAHNARRDALLQGPTPSSTARSIDKGGA